MIDPVLSNPSLPRLVYGFDPLCGWCFAFRGALRELRAHLHGRVSWEVACGVLVRDERIRPIGEQAQYLLAGEQMLTAAAGVKFGTGFHRLLADGRWVSRSEPPVRAVLLAQRLFGPDAAFQIGDELIRGFYEDGRPPDSPDTIAVVARQAGVDAEALLAAWRNGPEETVADVARANASGVRTYPSLLVRRGEALLPIHEGFATADALRRKVDSLLTHA